jgi:hypothetical protein
VLPAPARPLPEGGLAVNNRTLTPESATHTGVVQPTGVSTRFCR